MTDLANLQQYNIFSICIYCAHMRALFYCLVYFYAYTSYAVVSLDPSLRSKVCFNKFAMVVVVGCFDCWIGSLQPPFLLLHTSILLCCIYIFFAWFFLFKERSLFLASASEMNCRELLTTSKLLSMLAHTPPSIHNAHCTLVPYSHRLFHHPISSS